MKKGHPMNPTKLLAFFASLSMAATLALAQGPGGGGFNPGGGGNQPGGGGGTFTYDDILTPCTTNNGIVLRNGIAIRATSGATSLTAPATMTAILQGAFAGNTAITSVNLSAATSLAEIPAYAFAGCTALKTVILPDSCAAVGEGAFSGCTALASLTAPGLATVGDGAFEDCASLAALPPAAATLGDYAFAGTGLLAADLSGLTLSPGAFAGCTSLASVSGLPADLPDALFSGCTALEGLDASAFSSLGTAALAGVPFDEISLADAVTLAPYALAADAECTWVLNWTGTTTDETVFLGRNVETEPIDIALAAITGIEETYTVGSVALAPVLTYDGETLIESADYTWAVDSDDYLSTPGTYTATFTGIGDFTGTATASFTVEEAAESSGAVLTIYSIDVTTANGLVLTSTNWPATFAVEYTTNLLLESGGWTRLDDAGYDFDADAGLLALPVTTGDAFRAYRLVEE
jgi:hypothetical protein